MEERLAFAVKADNDYKAFIIRSIQQTFKSPEDSQTLCTVQEILSVFRGDYYAQVWFERELLNLGYKLENGRYKIELKNPSAQRIKIKL